MLPRSPAAAARSNARRDLVSARIARLQARRVALVAQIERERVAFSRVIADVAPLLRFADRVGAVAVSLRSQPMVIAAGYLGRALLWNTRLARWWRRIGAPGRTTFRRYR